MIRLGVGVTTLTLVTLAGCGAAVGSTPTPPPIGTAAPEPTTAGPTSSVPAPGTSEPATGPIPAGLLLPDEGRPGDCEPGDVPGATCFGAWMTDVSPGKAWLLDPCRPTAYPTDAARSSFRTVSQTGGAEALSARQLAVY